MGLQDQLADLENFVKGRDAPVQTVAPSHGMQEHYNEMPANDHDAGLRAMKAMASRWYGDGPAPQRQGNLRQIMHENEKRFRAEEDALRKAQEKTPELLMGLLKSFGTGKPVKVKINKAFSHTGEVHIDPASGSVLTGGEYVAAMTGDSTYLDGQVFHKAEHYPTDYREYLVEPGLELILKASHHIGRGIMQLHFSDNFGRDHEFTSDNMAKFFMNSERLG